MLRMIDFMRLVCRWHEHDQSPAQAAPGVTKAHKDQPTANRDEAVRSRSALTMTRAGVQADMVEMMQYFSINPSALPHYREELQEAENACAHCPTVARCHRWKHKEGQGDAPQLFCPNVELFLELATDQIWATAEQHEWPRILTALSWSRQLGFGLKEVSVDPPDIGPNKLRAFAEAAAKFDRVIETQGPQIGAADSEGHADRSRRETVLDMAGAIDEADGMTFEDYRAIFHVALCDSMVAHDLKDLIEQRPAD